jgi:sirohydrochlorin cobaltochelatase
VIVEDFSDAALVVLGHGSTKHARSGATVFQHAAELRARRIFGEVREAFWKQAPQLNEVLAELRWKRIFIVPLFISEGYFSENVVPRALGFDQRAGAGFRRQQCREGQQWFYCRPIGTHERMTVALLAKAQEIVQKFPFPRAPAPEQTTLFVAGHGTEQDENSRQAIERQVELIQGQKIYAEVHAIFLEEEPRIDACYQLARTRNLIVVPFFISDGMHVEEDIPVLLGEPERLVQKRLKAGQPTWRNPTEREGKLVWYTTSVGSDPSVAEMILDRAREVR